MVGHLFFRWQEDRTEKCLDILFNRDENIGRFFVLFFVIKSLSPASVEFRVGKLGRGTEDLQAYGTIDWDDYFRRFAPHRERAAEALCRDHAIPEKQAKVMVDLFFEERQLRRYEEDPNLAVRDMALILRERHRRFEEERAKRGNDTVREKKR